MLFSSPGQYEDYKYVMMDAGTLYLGAKFSYAEIIAHENVPFKFKTIVERYLLTDMEADTTLESHLYFMTRDSFACRTLQQLKAKIKCNVLVGKKKNGRIQSVYTTKVIPIAEFAAMDPKEKERQGMVIQEISIGKLPLMLFTV